MKLTAIAMILSVAVAAGCATHSATIAIPTSGTATPAQQAELKAADACAAVASGLQLAHDSLKALAQSGVVTPAEATPLFATLATVASKNDAAIAAIRAANASGTGTGYQASLKAVASAIATINPATLNIKNPNARATFTASLGVLEAALAVITPLVS